MRSPLLAVLLSTRLSLLACDARGDGHGADDPEWSVGQARLRTQGLAASCVGCRPVLTRFAIHVAGKVQLSRD